MTDLIARPGTIDTPYRSDRVGITKRTTLIAVAAIATVMAAVFAYGQANRGSTVADGAATNAVQLRWEGMAADYGRSSQAISAEVLRWEGLGSIDNSRPARASRAEQMRWMGLSAHLLEARSQSAIAAEAQRWSQLAQTLGDSDRARAAETSRWEGIAGTHDPS